MSSVTAFECGVSNPFGASGRRSMARQAAPVLGAHCRGCAARARARASYAACCVWRPLVPLATSAVGAAGPPHDSQRARGRRRCSVRAVCAAALAPRSLGRSPARRGGSQVRMSTSIARAHTHKHSESKVRLGACARQCSGRGFRVD